MLAEEAVNVITQVDLMNALNDLRLFVLGLAVLVLLVGFFLTRGQRRIARNQVELADLVRQLAGLCGKKPGDH